MASTAMQVETRDHDMILTRHFAAPPALVYQAWVSPQHFAQWWGPHTFTNPVCDLDPRPGGAYRVVMRSPDGVDYPLKGVYQELVENERIVMTIDCEEHPREWHELLNQLRGAVVAAHRFLALMTVTFKAQEGGTLLTIRQRFESLTDLDACMKMGAPEGWGQSLERLDALLGSR